MISRYRLLQLKPDLRRDDRITVGAFLRYDSEVQFIEAPSLPGADCLGSEKAKRRLDYIRETIARTGPEKWWEEIPSIVGHSVVLADVEQLEAKQPKAWLRRELLPSRSADRSQTKRRPSRAKRGKQFFENQGVGQYVHQRYTLNNVYMLAGLNFPNISLVTAGDSDVLLIEPLKSGLPQFKQDVEKAAERFQSAKYAADRQPDSFESKPFETVTVLLPGARNEDREMVEQKVAEATDHFFDTREKAHRIQARDLVREVGKQSDPFE